MLLAAIAACALPILAVDPAKYPYGVNGVDCGGGKWCPEDTVCGDPAYPSCHVGECCPTGSAFGMGSTRDAGRD